MKKTRKAKNISSHLQNEDKHVIRVLPCFMPIPCGLAVTAKGTPNEAHHNHMHGISPPANSWLDAMTGADKVLGTGLTNMLNVISEVREAKISLIYTDSEFYRKALAKAAPPGKKRPRGQHKISLVDG